MKKLLLFMCALCLTAVSFGLTACGTTYAKIVGIMTGVLAEQDHSYSYTYGNPLSDNETLFENENKPL